MYDSSPQFVLQGSPDSAFSNPQTLLGPFTTKAGEWTVRTVKASVWICAHPTLNRRVGQPAAVAGNDAAATVLCGSHWISQTSQQREHHGTSCTNAPTNSRTQGIDMSPYADKQAVTFRIVQVSQGWAATALYVAGIELKGAKVGGQLCSQPCYILQTRHFMRLGNLYELNLPLRQHRYVMHLGSHLASHCTSCSASHCTSCSVNEFIGSLAPISATTHAC